MTTFQGSEDRCKCGCLRRYHCPHCGGCEFHEDCEIFEKTETERYQMSPKRVSIKWTKNRCSYEVVDTNTLRKLYKSGKFKSKENAVAKLEDQVKKNNWFIWSQGVF